MPLGPRPTELSRYKHTVQDTLQAMLVALDTAIDSPGHAAVKDVLTELGTFRLTICLVLDSPQRGTDWDR